LPDRFDKDGQPLDSDGYPFLRQQRMVERIVHDREDVLEERQTWRSLLRGFFEAAAYTAYDSLNFPILFFSMRFYNFYLFISKYLTYPAPTLIISELPLINIKTIS
jgi:hypothetical protein